MAKQAQDGLLYTQTGTPFYASPEVWMDKPYDNKSDIWSLGVLLYQMAALKLPFRSKNMATLSKQVLSGDIPKIPEGYSKRMSLIKLLLNQNPVKRPSCTQLLKLLRS